MILSLKKFDSVILIAAGLVGFALPGHAAAVQSGARDGAAVNGVEQTLTIDCEGRPAAVSGSDNRITFVGDCPSLTLNGVDNQVSISLRPGAPLKVSGVDNVVTWRIDGKGRPKLSIQGVGNDVRAAK
jgi:hypothetical protein